MFDQTTVGHEASYAVQHSRVRSLLPLRAPAARWRPPFFYPAVRWTWSDRGHHAALREDL